MNTANKILRRIARWMAFTMPWMLAAASVSAQAIQPGLYIPPQTFSANSVSPLSADSCLNETGGSFQVGAVNVGGKTDFYVIIPAPAPEGGVIVTVTSDDPGIIAAIDPSSGGTPTLFVPEGQWITTASFRQIGNAVGRTQLNIIANPSVHPDTGTPLSYTMPVAGWDVGDTRRRFVDANAPGNHCRVSDDDPALSSDGNKLASCGDSDIAAVATDGVTPILMRLKAGLAGQGCFEITSNVPPAQGTITAGVTNTQTVGSLEQAFSFYYPPDEFVDTARTRTVDVEFAYTPIVAGKRANTTRFRDTLTLVRPPVVLMHGLWADEKSWEDDFVDNVRGPDPDGIVVRGDYAASNAEELTANLDEVKEAIKRALKDTRNKGIAVTQADYVGHSMGGLLGRLHISDRDYRRPANLDKGDIRRFVSLNTPHFGTNLANLLIALHENTGTDVDIEEDVREVIELGESPGQAGNITAGAICSLAQNSADLGRLAASVPMAHVFTATGGPTGSEADPAEFWESIFAELFEDRFTARRCIGGAVILGFCTGTWVPIYPQAVVDAFRFRERNDLIVPLSSQLGGVNETSQASTNDGSIEHFDSFITRGYTKDAATARQIRSILDANTTSAMLATLPAVSSLGNGASIFPVPGQGAAIDAAVYANQCASGGSMNSFVSGPVALLATAQALAYDPNVRIVSPIEGQVFEPGDTVNIVVELLDPNFVGGISGSMTFFGAFSDEEAPYELSAIVSERASGMLTVTARAFTYDGARFTNHKAQPVHIIVRRSTPPDRLIVESSVSIRTPRPVNDVNPPRIFVKGIYNGVEVNLNPSVTGTTYVSSDPGIVTVDSEGVLTPVSLGRAVVTVENQGVKDFSMVAVRDSNGLIPPEEVTGRLDIQRSGIRLNRRTGMFIQRVTITNPTELPIGGSMALILEGLTPGVTAVNRTTSTDRILPGSPQFDIPMDSRLHSLLPGTTVTFDIEFVNPNRQRIQYTPRVFVAREF